MIATVRLLTVTGRTWRCVVHRVAISRLIVPMLIPAGLTCRQGSLVRVVSYLSSYLRASVVLLCVRRSPVPVMISSGRSLAWLRLCGEAWMWCVLGLVTVFLVTRTVSILLRLRCWPVANLSACVGGVGEAVEVGAVDTDWVGVEAVIPTSCGFPS